MCPIESELFPELLLAYGAGTLDAETARIVERHIETCPACKRKFEAQREVWAALDEWEALPAASDFDLRLYERIDREAALPWWHRLSAPLRPLLAHKGLPVVAAACLVMAAGLILRPSEVPSAVSTEVRVDCVQPDQVERTLEDLQLLYSLQRDMRASGQPSAM